MIPQTPTYARLLKSELHDVKALMLDRHALIPQGVAQAIACIVQNGGKRLRPALVLLSAHLCDAEIARALPVAAAVEMLHTATLIHDDLVDNALLRRGTRTLNAAWSPSATVLAGDVAFAWAARLATHSRNLRLVERFAETLETICYGELEQMFEGRGKLPTAQAYERRIFAKTASLFALSAEAGAILAEAAPAQCERLRRFGRLVGEAFQIADDVLDFAGTRDDLGKPVGSDLRQGLITLPVLHYHRTHPQDGRVQAVMDGTADEATVAALVADLRRSDAATWALQQAEARVAQARELLEPCAASPYRQALQEIATFATHRRT